MSEVKRKYVIPGEEVAAGDHQVDVNVIRVGDRYFSTRVGMAEIGRAGLRVIPLSGPYAPRPDDVVIGKVVNYTAMAWEIDINSFFFGILPASSVFGKEFSPERDSLADQLDLGDVLTAKVVAFDRGRDPLLTISGQGLGKITRGETTKISPTKVPRLIGKKGSMIRMIEVGSEAELAIGQNGIIVLTGSDEGVLRAKEAITLVENEAHTADLTQKVQSLLGVEQEAQ